MQTKILEIRDSATFILVLCVDMNPTPISINDRHTSRDYQAERHAYQCWALRTYGFPCDKQPNILITPLRADGKANNDPYSWGDRTFKTAHNFITDHWHELSEGDVVDVEFILGETKAPKTSQRLTEVPF